MTLIHKAEAHDDDLIRRVAAALWRAETIDAGVPQSVTDARTPEAFAEQPNYTRTNWAKLARAAIAAIPARGVGVKPDRDTFDAMCAMRDSINEHVPMPSLESDLLQGPENSVFCATVAEAVIKEVTRLRSMTNAARVKMLEWHNFDAWTHWAEGACGTYHVEERNGYWQVELRVGGLVHGVAETGDTLPEDLDAAKAAAQADYEARILAALEPAPTDAAQARKKLDDLERFSAREIAEFAEKHEAEDAERWLDYRHVYDALAPTDAPALKEGQYRCERCGKVAWGGDHVCRGSEALTPTDAAQAGVAVWYGSMPESNGRQNWTAMIYPKESRDRFLEGFCFARSEYPDRVRYAADRMRWVIGELPERPDILAYDDKLHSGYVEPPDPAAQAREAAQAMLNLHDDFLAGKPVDLVAANCLHLAASFGAQAFAVCPEPDARPSAMLRAFLLAMIDPMHPDLDYLRAKNVARLIREART